MSVAVQITLIICATIIISQIISCFRSEYKDDNYPKYDAPSSKYPRPPKTGSGIKDNSRLEVMRKS